MVQVVDWKQFILLMCIELSGQSGVGYGASLTNDAVDAMWIERTCILLMTIFLC